MNMRKKLNENSIWKQAQDKANQPLKHTPTTGKYEIDGFDLTSIIVKHPSGDGWLKVADCNGEFPIDEQIANARHIVKCVNNHEDLIFALKKAIWIILDMPDTSFIPAPSNAKQADIITSHKMANDLLSALKSAGEEV